MSVKEFFRDPQYTSVKTVLLIVLLIGFAGYVYTMGGNKGNEGRVINTNTTPAGIQMCDPHNVFNADHTCVHVDADCTRHGSSEGYWTGYYSDGTLAGCFPPSTVQQGVTKYGGLSAAVRATLDGHGIVNDGTPANQKGLVNHSSTTQ